MNNIFNSYRYLILRRFTQVMVILLYMAGNYYSWSILQGNLSSSLLFDTIPLSDPFAVLQMFFSGIVLSIDVIIGGLIITIVYGIVGGRMFCSYVCPINIVTDAANYLRNKLGFNIIQKKQPASKNIRYWVLALSLILSYILGLSAFEYISPISITHRGLIFGMGFAWTAMLVIFLFDLFVLKNGWCGHICPLGGFYSIVGKYSLLRVEHKKENCTACMECKVVCPESHVLFMVDKQSLQIQNGDCTNCARCIEVCNDDALSFTIRDFKQKEKNENNI
jgi:ferredoxin-type protein NapH